MLVFKNHNCPILEIIENSCSEFLLAIVILLLAPNEIHQGYSGCCNYIVYTRE